MSCTVSDKICQVISSHIGECDTVFVFPTEVIAASWVDWAVRNPEESGALAVCTDRFIAWDKFKGSFACSVEADKIPVPPLMRKVFVQNLLRDNMNGAGDFRRIIPADEKYRKNSFAFTDWVSKVLPSLKLWNRQYTQVFKRSASASDDDENRDYLRLYKMYSEFLSENGFYEPAWLDVDFDPRGRKFIIFYPEIIEDFAEFQEALSGSSSTVFVTETPEKPVDCVVYPDARKELRRLALQLRKLYLENVDLRKVAVNIPDLENIRPYVEREFRLYAIPYSIRAGLPVTRNCGGDIFSKIRDCISSNCSYDSIRALLLDNYIPWKDELENENLVRAGKELRCVCSYFDGRLRDMWEESLGDVNYAKEKAHYLNVRDSLRKFSGAKTFSALLDAWKNFRDLFIDQEYFMPVTERDSEAVKAKKENCSLTNRVLGRMITELTDLESVEKQYMKPKNFYIENVLDFFINEMEHKTYTPNEKTYGVSVFPYRTSVCADFEYQFIVNATQSDLTVPFRKLTFITDDDKRRAFGLKADGGESGSTNIFAAKDVSQNFLNLYAMDQRDSVKKTVFITSARTNFSGAAITHTALREIDSENPKRWTEKDAALIKELDALDELDFIAGQKRSLEKMDVLSKDFSLMQKNSFENWKNTAVRNDGGASVLSDRFRGRMQASLKMEQGKDPKLSYSSMMNFFRCPRYWVLSRLDLEEDSLDANLMRPNETGTFYHRIIELVFRDFMENNRGRLPVFDGENWLFASGEINGTQADSGERIRALVEEKYNEAKPEVSFFESALAMRVLDSQRKLFVDVVVKFLRNFCGPYDLKNRCFGGLTISGLEEERNFSQDGISFSGKVDCILTDEDDGEIIVDFKTGKAPSYPECRVDADGALENFQMSVYVLLLENAGDKEKKYSPETACFAEVKNKMKVNYVFGGSGRGTIPRQDFDATMDVFKDYSRYFKEKAEEMDFEPHLKADPRYAVYPTDCMGCSFNSVCRTSFKTGGIKIKD